MAIASFGVQAASAVAGFAGQQANYRRQRAATLQNAESARQSAVTTYAFQQQRILQEREAGVQQNFEASIDGMKARSTAAAAAGEAGVVGLSVENLLGDYYGRASRYSEAVDRNFQMSRSSIVANMESTRAGAQNQINSMPMPQRPSFLDAGLRIAGAAVGSAGDYYAMRNQTRRAS